MDVQVNEDVFSLVEGQGILVLPGQIHCIRTRGKSRNYLCIFDRSHVPKFARVSEGVEFCKPVFDFPGGGFIDGFADSATNEFLLKSFLYLVCGLAVAGGTKSTKQDRLLIGKIAEYIADHFHEPLTLKQLSKDLGYNYNYLSCYFNGNMSTGFSKFLNEHRVNYAKRLLRKTDASISEVAFDCGFSSIRSFNRAFIQAVRVAPREYRRDKTLI